MRIILIAVLLCFSIQGISQEIQVKDSLSAIISAEGTWLNKKVYLKCTVKNQREDGFLVFEVKSDSGYQYIGNTPVSGVPVDFPLLYCFSYEDAEFKGAEFRVTCLTPGKEKSVSIPFKVEKRIHVETAEIDKKEKPIRD